jgi:methylated-DNA-[protein]-cysteine S-methyltransferase
MPEISAQGTAAPESTASLDRGRAPIVGQAVLAAPGFGDLHLAWSDAGLVSLGLPDRFAMLPEDAAPIRALPELYRSVLAAYFNGEAVDPVALPVDLRGTAFQVRVWQALRRVPRGEVRSYAQIAQDVGSPRGMRAVGMANARNPIAIVVPCHRIVEAKLGLGGYSGGLDMKRFLLELEGVHVRPEGVHPGQLELPSA